MKIKSEVWIGIAAITISIGTLVVLIYQSRLMRDHQESSVFPKLELWNSPYNDQYALIMVNKGVGPAIIESIKVHFEDQSYEMDPMQFMYVYSDTLNWFDQEITGNSVAPGLFIPPGQSQQLIRVDGALDDNLAATLFYQQRARVSVTYSSVFGDAWKVDGIFSLPEKLDRKEARIHRQLLGR